MISEKQNTDVGWAKSNVLINPQAVGTGDALCLFYAGFIVNYAFLLNQLLGGLSTGFFPHSF